MATTFPFNPSSTQPSYSGPGAIVTQQGRAICYTAPVIIAILDDYHGVISSATSHPRPPVSPQVCVNET